MDEAHKGWHYPNMRQIPIYALYGETDSLRSADWLHWETIQSRSRMHDYRIAPHRHEELFQLLLLTAGEARVTLEGETLTLKPPAVVIVPALAVHGYTFSPDVGGTVLTLMERDVRSTGLPTPEAGLLRDGIAPISDAIRQLIAEADHPGEGHDIAMRALLSLLVVALRRTSRGTTVPPTVSARAVAHARAFRQLVDERFRETRRIGDYAQALGISQTHLNRACRQVLGHSALAVIERRIALEARRQLIFSTLSIKQIGTELGYDDPAYFSRAMTRLLGEAPTAIRGRAYAATDSAG